MNLADISLYPVKSLRAVRRPSAVVEPWGLASDRRYLVVDHQGRFLTQRECGTLAQIQAEPVPGGLVLRHAAHPALALAAPGLESEPTTVTIWRDNVAALPVGPAADDWLSTVLGRPCRLVHMGRPDRDRPVDPDFGRNEDHVSFADGFPVLLTTQASLDDLNGRLASPVGMERFRPNLVVSGNQAWEEDGWRQIRIGAVVFDVVKPCTRCVVVTTDQASGIRDPAAEPLRSLQRYRRDATGKVMFGQNLIPRSSGTIAVGDTVEVLAERPRPG